MIVPKHYENLHVLHENTMPERSYYIPASTRMDNLIQHREDSDRIQLLNGNWKFRYYSSIYDVKKNFYEPEHCTEGYGTLLMFLMKIRAELISAIFSSVSQTLPQKSF